MMGNTTASRNISARRAATFLAALGMLVMSSGVALMVAATPANAAVGPNDAAYWETEPGEQCVKSNDSADSGGFTMPAEEAGRDWSKLILKKGSGNIGEENQVFHDPVAGQTYTWQGFEDKHDGGWSHYILCSVPEVVPPTVCPDGSDKAGQDVPEGLDPEEFCNEEENPPVCPEGGPKAGQEVPEGQTVEDFCSEVSPPTVCPDGTDNAGQPVPEGETAEEFCDVDEQVSPPGGTVDPPEDTSTPTTTTTVSTPTVVSAGLGGATTDLRGEQGLALVFAGMVMLVCAGGLGLRLRGVAARI